ncbi:hypothetical protein NLU13_9708 [Sarocladium strictum]|uniref:Flavin-containing monooxygenase n=1 Tax=Sarocladium strictum TaxID=5046 RepID=A0AA39GAL2_SARSR|nr:hypothetical protein NLU13_9708 [Sarocladium strictum]
MASHKNGVDDEVPPRAALSTLMAENPLPTVPAGTVSPESMAGSEATVQAKAVLDSLNAAIAAKDPGAVAACFYSSQAWWKDSLALTYHLRTFKTPDVVAQALLETVDLRGCGKFSVQGEAVFIPATPFLQFVDCGITFRTSSPAATCTGKVVLLPSKTSDDKVEWKIWVLNTRLASLDLYPEDEELLHAPAQPLDGAGDLDTDVLILGAGNAAVSLAARLKAVGVSYIMAEKNAKVGDNWALRYDSLKFHVPTSFCEMPYLNYRDEFKSPYLLTKNDLAEQVIRYVDAFHLNVLTSAKLVSTIWDKRSKTWKTTFETPAGLRTIKAKHFVQATGVGSQKPYVPQIPDGGYQGKSMHSQSFRNGKALAAEGVKSVIVVGSANTAFDVLDDCHASGLQVTMVVRSPTFICPTEYVVDQRSLGAYDFGVEAADRLFLSLPSPVDGALAKGLFAMMASQEPDRYKPLADAGFPVLTAMDPQCALMSNLIEKCGKHYMDIGATQLIAEKKVGLKALVEPKAFTKTGLEFSDGTTLDADAVIWCTGFADKNVKKVAADILGGENVQVGDGQLGPKQLAPGLDATWGIDSEGEIRGMWKRHPRLEGVNYWIAGGYTQQHRFHSLTLALQIKAELEGILPPPYLKTPGSAA